MSGDDRFNVGQMNDAGLYKAAQQMSGGIMHYVDELQLSGEPAACPALKTACGERLYEILYDMGDYGTVGLAKPRIPIPGVLRVYPIAGENRIDGVNCLACLRVLAKKGNAK